MKISLQWLSSCFKEVPIWSEAWDKLTQAGIEIESIEDTQSHVAINGSEPFLTDTIIEFKITPNRGDCLSIFGIAREIALLTSCALNDTHNIFPHCYNTSPPVITSSTAIQVDQQDLCPKYCATVIRGINNQVTLPDYIMHRLKVAGINTVNPVVDILNYVMLELGQPLHAFELMATGERLRIHMAPKASKVILLNNTEVELYDDTLVVSGSTDNICAIAGVMGSLASGVMPNTRDIVIESAFFEARGVVGQARKYGAHSEAAYRFERGVDIELVEPALQYASNLIIHYCAGTIEGTTIFTTGTSKEHDCRHRGIIMVYDKITQLLGVAIDVAIIHSLLVRIGFAITHQERDRCTVFPPSFRTDINIAEDVIEEIARVYGYDNIPPIMPTVTGSINAPDVSTQIQDSFKQTLVHCGYNEIISYSFLEDKYVSILSAINPDVVPSVLCNPIANLGTMRTTLTAGLMKTLTNNINRGHKNIRIFELARVFYGTNSHEQPVKLAGLLYGSRCGFF